MARKTSHDFQRRQRERERKEKTAARVEKKKARALAARERAARGEPEPVEGEEGFEETLDSEVEPGDTPEPDEGAE